MATLPRITIPEPQNVLDTFGALAKYRLERGTSALNDFAEVTTGTVLATQTEYEYADATGVAGTHYYRARYSTASPTLSTHYSGYGAVFQAGAPGGEVITLETAKTWTANSDTTDDPWLPIAVNAINRAIVRGVGVDLGSSPDTTRTFRSSEVKADGRRLWVPGGIRAFTTVETGDGTTWTAVTSYVEVGPAAHLRPSGEPGAYIEVKPEASTDLCASYYVRITGTAFATFGWDAWPQDLVQDAAAALQRMTLDRSRQGNYPTETAAMQYLNAKLMASYRNMYFPGVR